MKLIFMGTPDFAAVQLEALCKAGHEIVLVVTQPDKPKGRSGKCLPSPVKSVALEKGLSVFQPTRIRDEEALIHLRQVSADVCVVAAFGQILPEEILRMPKLGCVNIHASLLPKYRGAAPIQQAILNGDTRTGTTIMQMDVGMDTGDILLQEELAIAPADTAGSLFDKLAAQGAELIVKALPLLERGELTPVRQDEAQATKCGKITKEAGRIDWSRQADQIVNHIRAYTPWPAAYCMHQKKMMKILEAQAVPAELSQGGSGAQKEALPGSVLRADKTGLVIACADSALKILRLQPEGKKPMDAAGFLNGHRLLPGDVFA